MAAGEIGGPAEAAIPERPNILLIIADDLGSNDVGYQGSGIRTPNLDRLAASGVRLARFYTAPICSPTRAGLLTGRYPDRFGLRSTTVTPWSRAGLPPEETTLPEILAQHGYRDRALLGKWHLGHASRDMHPLSQGFTEFYGHYNGGIDHFDHTREGEVDWHDGFETVREEGYTTDLLTQRTLEFLDRQQPATPFYLQVAFSAPHSPLQATDEALATYGFNPNAPRLSEGDSRQYGSSDPERFTFLPGRHTGNSRRQTFAAMVTEMDAATGKILERLEQRGLTDHTIVIFCSDNGGQLGVGGSNHPLRGGKTEVWEGGVRVPAIIRAPGWLPEGTTVDAVTAYIDIVPTLLARLRISPPEDLTLDGLDVGPLLEGRHPVWYREVYLGDGALVRHDWKWVRGELFHILSDPSETKDLAGPARPIADEMRDRVRHYESLSEGVPKPAYETGREHFVAPKEWRIEPR